VLRSGLQYATPNDVLKQLVTRLLERRGLSNFFPTIIPIFGHSIRYWAKDCVI
jgi:hypothetical protein